MLPVTCLAVYEDGTLVDLYPHADGERTVSVADGLDRLVGGVDEVGRGGAEAAD